MRHGQGDGLSRLDDLDESCGPSRQIERLECALIQDADDAVNRSLSPSRTAILNRAFCDSIAGCDQRVNAAQHVECSHLDSG